MNALTGELAGVGKAMVNRLVAQAEEGVALVGLEKGHVAALLLSAAIDAAMKCDSYQELETMMKETLDSVSLLARLERGEMP